MTIEERTQELDGLIAETGEKCKNLEERISSNEEICAPFRDKKPVEPSDNTSIAQGIIKMMPLLQESVAYHRSTLSALQLLKRLLEEFPKWINEEIETTELARNGSDGESIRIFCEGKLRGLNDVFSDFTSLINQTDK